MRYGEFLILLFVGIFCSMGVCAQKNEQTVVDITGLWKGELYNDSTRQNYRYEIGLSEEKGKITGFSHTWYNERDYFVVKKLKGKRTRGKLIIEDVDIIAYNYPESPPKGVRRLHVLDVLDQDSLLTLSGVFSTNQTKTYAPATGTIRLQRKNDFRKHSDLMAHLQELGLEKDLSFVRKEIAEEEEASRSLTKTNTAVVAPLKPAEPVATAPSTVKSSGKTQVKIAPPKSTPVAVVNPPVAKTQQLEPPVAATVPAAADVLNRRNIVQETLYFSADSLELALYDNGEVDGDTVSVLVNGNIVLAKQRLSTNAIRKTIIIPATADSIELLMYAESLGTLPPNSGLLVVKDGKEIYEIRFSGDLQKNAAVVFKRKK